MNDEMKNYLNQMYIEMQKGILRYGAICQEQTNKTSGGAFNKLDNSVVHHPDHWIGEGTKVEWEKDNSQRTNEVPWKGEARWKTTRRHGKIP